MPTRRRLRYSKAPSGRDGFLKVAFLAHKKAPSLFKSTISRTNENPEPGREGFLKEAFLPHKKTHKLI